MSDDTAELLGAMQRMCVGAEIDRSDLARLEGDAHERITIYRELVRSRLRDLATAAYPRTTRLIGRAAMLSLADEHISAARLDTRFFREHAEVFGAWAIDVLTRRPLAPAWALDLLRLEAAQWPANYRPSVAPADCVAFDLELVPIPSRTLALLTTEWSVHTSGDGEPERGTFQLAVYRRPDHQVETRWMAPIWFTLLTRIARGDEAAIDSVRATLSVHERVADAAFVDEMTTFLAALVDNGAILGSVARD